jgi:hypothetical protein
MGSGSGGLPHQEKEVTLIDSLLVLKQQLGKEKRGTRANRDSAGDPRLAGRGFDF